VSIVGLSPLVELVFGGRPGSGICVSEKMLSTRQVPVTLPALTAGGP